MVPSQEFAEASGSASGPQLWQSMGTQQSLPEGARLSRSPSPLPGDDEMNGFDGLPRDLPPSTMPEAEMGFSDLPEMPMFASQQPQEQAAKRSRKKRKDSKRSIDFGADMEAAAQEEHINDENQELNAMVEPESPDAHRRKKKKSRKAKARTGDVDPSQDFPAQELPLESQILGNEPGHALLQDVEAELQQPSNTRKKRRKSRTDSGNRKPLEIGEDPIAEGEDDNIIPSSVKVPSPERRRSSGSVADGARKFKQPGSISAPNGDAIEDEDDVAPPPAADVVTSKQDEVTFSFPGSSAILGESSFMANQDVSSPLLARKDRREKSASRQASAAPETYVKHNNSDPVPEAAMELDPMEVESFFPSQPSVQLGIDDAMGDDVTQSTPSVQPNGHGLEERDLTSSIDDETMLAIATAQTPLASSAGHNTINGLSMTGDLRRGEDDAQSTTSEQSVETAKQAEAARRKRKQVQEKSPESEHDGEHNDDDTASNAAPASTADGDEDRVLDEAEIQRKFNAEFAIKAPDGESHHATEDEAMDVEPQEPTTPAHAAPTPTRTSGRLTRSYKKRQPKPTFYEREEQDNAEAFAALPSEEAAESPKKRTRAKRRLPVDIPAADGGASSSAPKAKRQRKAKTVKPEANGDDDGDTTLDGSGYLTGAFTAEEFGALEKVVEEFRQEHGMTQYQVNALMAQSPKEPMTCEIFNRLQEVCPKRRRQKIINVCRQRFHNFVARGTWTPEQDDELLEQIERHGTKWSVIGKEINRHQKDVRDRWRNYLVCRGKANESNWTPEEESRFLDIVLEALRIFGENRKANPDSEIFGNKTNEQLVDWGIVSERMGHSRTRLQCQEKWRRLRTGHKLDSRFAGQLPDWMPYGASWRHDKARKEIRKFTHDNKYKLVCAISEADVRSDAKIPWAKVEERMGLKGKVERVTLMIMWSRLRAAVPDQENKNTTACAEYLVEMYEKEAEAFGDLGNDEVDSDTEHRMISEHIAATAEEDEAAPKPKSKKSRASKQTKAKRPSYKSEELIVESDEEQGEQDKSADQADPSQANGEAQPPVEEHPLPQANGEDADMEDADHISIDLADNSFPAQPENQFNGHIGNFIDPTLQGNIDPSLHQTTDPSLHRNMDPSLQDNIDPRLQNLDDLYNPVIAHHDAAPASSAAKPKKRRKTSQLEAPAEITVGQASSSANKSRKRKDANDEDPSSQSPKTSRKRMRINNIVGPDSPATAVRKKAKKAMRPGEAHLASQASQADVSSDMEDMDDIPSQLPVANMG